VRASLRLMVKRMLRKYKYPPDLADAAVELVLEQAESLGEEWVQNRIAGVPFNWRSCCARVNWSVS
jgi:hypothetical protein